MSLLRGKEAREDSFQFRFIERFGIFFLWSRGWFDKIFLKLIENRWSTALFT